MLVVVEPDAEDRAVPQGNLDPAARLVPDGSRREEVAADQEQVPPEDANGSDLVGAGRPDVRAAAVGEVARER